MEQLDIFSAPTTKQQAMDLFETTRQEFLSHCRWIAKRIFKEKGHVTVDDIREQVKIPNGIDGRVMGAVFNTDEWEKVGYTQTKIKTSHGRPIAVFRYLLLFILIFTIYAFKTAGPARADEGTRQELIQLSKQVAAEDRRLYALRRHSEKVAGVKKILVEANSPMAEDAESFIGCGERYGVDWKLLLGLAEHESGYGKHGYAVHSKNAFGWGVHDGITFGSWSDGVCAVAKGLAGPRYKGRSIEDIIHIYAPASDNNDPDSYAYKLINSIRRYEKKV